MKFQKGFTLIEIVMVLVLLGILSAVAVPKYYDLQTEAEKKAAHAVFAEYQARVNAIFAQGLLKGLGCTDARAAVWAGDTTNGITAIGTDFGDDWEVETAASATSGALKIKRKSGSKSSYTGGSAGMPSIQIPACANDGSS